MSKALRARATGRALPSACLAALAITVLLLTSGCAVVQTSLRTNTAELPDSWSQAVDWLTPSSTRDAATLARWRHGVGAPVAWTHPAAPASPADKVMVVSWNVATGRGDVARLLDTLAGRRPIVLMLQEAYRSGSAVPSALDLTASFAGRLGGVRVSGADTDVESLASVFGLSLFYVPSMRNGGISSDEDRGNAILSNLPLTDLQAVELPFERQRRVAVAATVSGTDGQGRPWKLRVVSAHLDGLSSARSIWLGGEFSRARQARALRDAVRSDDAVVLGGDFNTWFAFSEPAFVETLVEFPDTTLTDRRATFGGILRLDHLFFDLEPGWRAAFARAETTFGSDHYPLVGTIHLR